MINKVLLMIILAMVIVIGGMAGVFLGHWEVPFQKKKTLEGIQVEYLAAVMTSDCVVQGEDPEVCEEVGRSALRYADRHGKSPEQIFKGGLTLIPVGHVRGTYVRWLLVVRWEANNWNAVLASAQKVADAAGGNVPAGCATHYIRSSRSTDPSAQPDDVKKQLQTTMKSQGKFKNKGSTEFLCP